MSLDATAASARYAPWLWLLLALFVVRVVAQPLALIVHAGFLPPFEEWQSGAVPYPILVVAQVLIILWLWRTAARFTGGRVVPRRRLGAIMLALGGIYFLTMVVRLVLGLTLLSEQRWFASPIPTVFHLVLATALLLYGHFHFRYGIDRQ
jgi:uncharacterized protein